MIRLQELQAALFDAIRAAHTSPLFVASDIGACDDGNLIVCEERPDAYVQVGTIVIETGEYQPWEDPEHALRRPKDVTGTCRDASPACSRCGC